MLEREREKPDDQMSNHRDMEEEKELPFNSRTRLRAQG